MRWHLLGAAAVLALAAGAVMAQQDIVVARQNIMTSNGRSLGDVLYAIMKGRRPYRQSDVDAAIADLENGAKKLPDLFPDSTKGLRAPKSEYSAAPKLWDDKAAFAAQIASYAKAIAAARASVKNTQTLKAAAPAINQECLACHETFRLKDG